MVIVIINFIINYLIIYTIETKKWTIFSRTSLHSNVEALHPRVKHGYS